MNVANILESISVILASLVASGAVVYGVNAWRREYVGKRKIELAEEVLALFYEAQDVIRQIRSPFGSVGEGSTRNPSPNESQEEKQINDKAYVAFERYYKRQDLFNKLYSMRCRYTTHFGKDSAKPFNDLSKIVNEILTSARVLTFYWMDQGHRQWENNEEFQKHLKEMHKHEAVFWEMSADEDTITPRVNMVISDIEAQARSIIK
jgi:hypothetical protein